MVTLNGESREAEGMASRKRSHEATGIVYQNSRYYLSMVTKNMQRDRHISVAYQLACHSASAQQHACRKRGPIAHGTGHMIYGTWVYLPSLGRLSSPLRRHGSPLIFRLPLVFEALGHDPLAPIFDNQPRVEPPKKTTCVAKIMNNNQRQTQQRESLAIETRPCHDIRVPAYALRCVGGYPPVTRAGPKPNPNSCR